MGFKVRRSGTAVLAALLIAACCAVPVYGASSGNYSPYKTGQATGDQLNVRAGASTSAKVLGTFKKGDKMALRGYSGDWYRISYAGKKAYVSKKYVKKVSTLSYIIATPARTGKVKADDVRIRAGASTKSAVKTKYNKGKSVSVTGTKKGGGYNWYRIKYGNSVAYICTKYVKLDPATKTAVKAAETPAAVRTGKVTASQVRVRAAASTKSAIKATYKKGKIVTVTGTKKGGGYTWYIIKYGKSTAYICSKYVKLDPVTPAKPAVKDEVVSYSPYKTGQMKVTDNVVRTPESNGKALGKLYKGYKFTVKGHEIKNGIKWYRTSYNGYKSYVKAANVSVVADIGFTIYRPFKYAEVTAYPSLNIRKGPSTETAKQGTLLCREEVYIKGYTSGQGHTWYCIQSGSGYGYVRSDYVCIMKPTLVGNSMVKTGPDRIVDLALSKVGCKYVSGAEGPNTFDCSGFVWWVINTANVTKESPKFERDGATKEYYSIEKYKINDMTEAQAGDICFYGTYNKTTKKYSMTHTGICIGNDQVVHASGKETGVKVSNIKMGNNPPLQAVVRLPYK